MHCGSIVNKAPRSYDVNINGATYRRNRRQLVCSGEPPVRDVSLDDVSTGESSCAESTAAVPQDETVRDPDPVPSVVHAPRRSSRERHRPSHLRE